MTQDSEKKIGKLKNIAIDRCRERIEQAACKAKELMNKPKSEGQKEGTTNYNQPSGITSFLKKGTDFNTSDNENRLFHCCRRWGIASRDLTSSGVGWFEKI